MVDDIAVIKGCKTVRLKYGLRNQSALTLLIFTKAPIYDQSVAGSNLSDIDHV